MTDTSPQPHNRVVAIKSDGGNYLLSYHVDSRVLEVHRRGCTYMIPMQDLIDFGRTSERSIFRVVPTARVVDVAEDVVRQEFE